MTNPSTPPLNWMRHATLCAGLLAASLAQAQTAPTYEMRVMVPGMKPATASTGGTSPGGTVPPAGATPPAVVTPPAPALVPALVFQNDSGDNISRLVFPNTPVGGSSALQRVVLANMGTAPVVFDTPFDATSPFSMATSTCPSSLAPGSACDVTVRFSPSAQQAYAGGTYKLATSSNAGLRYIELEGVGIVLVRINSLAYGGLEGASQARVPVQGGVVTLTGAGFDSTSTVSLANGDAITPSSVSETSLTFQAPAGTAGSQLTVAVRTGAQQFEVNQGLAYVVPALASVSPPVGDINGNLEVTLSGSGFLPGATVKFGNSSATSVVVAADGASLTARTPAAAAAGDVSVTVTNPGGSASVQANGFTYAMPSQSIGISGNVVNYNLATALGNPTQPKNFVVTINAGVVLTASVSTTAAFDTGALPAGSTVTLVNRGSIYGRGGNGGAAGAYSVAPGNAGGTAVNMRVPLTIDNGDGSVWGGGGGGGSGAAMGSNGSGGSGGGGAGGSAAGTGCSSNHCIDGLAGTAGATGVGGAAGYAKYNSYRAGVGGAYGKPGVAGMSYNGEPPGAGGIAGSAFRRNGNTLTFTAGNTASQVKGLVN